MWIAKCDDCGVTGYFHSDAGMYVLGWAIARNRLNCYCPKCAPLHRHTGRKGAKKMVNKCINHLK